MQTPRDVMRSFPILVVASLAMLSVLLPENVPAIQVVTVVQADQGRTIKLERGDTLVISLESNPSTGYVWQIDKHESPILKLASPPVFQPATHPMPGAPGHQRFEFTAVWRGSGSIELDYLRPWEKGVVPAKTFTVVVTVK